MISFLDFRNVLFVQKEVPKIVKISVLVFVYLLQVLFSSWDAGVCKGAHHS